MDLTKITLDLERLEKEITKAEKDLNTAEAQKELLQKQGLDHGVKNIKEAKIKIEEYKNEMQNLEKQIEDGYNDLKSNFEWS